MGTWWTKATINGMPVDICPDRMGAFFMKFGQVHEVKILRSKAGIAIGNMEISFTVYRKNFNEIPQHSDLLKEENAGCCGGPETVLLGMWSLGAHG